jgi:methylglyoxal synthase
MKELGIALLAHSFKNGELLQFVYKHRSQLEQFHLYSTEETGILIQSNTGLPVAIINDESEGVRESIAGLVKNERVQAVIILGYLPATGNGDSDDLDILNLISLCSISNTYLATNVVTGDAILNRFDYIEEWAGEDLTAGIVYAMSRQDIEDYALSNEIPYDEVLCMVERNVYITEIIHSFRQSGMSAWPPFEHAEEAPVCAK